MRIKLFSTIAVLVLGVSTYSFGEESKLKIKVIDEYDPPAKVVDTEAALDDLEKNLLKQEKSTLKLGSPKGKKKAKKKPTKTQIVKKLKYEGSTITGKTAEMRELTAIGKAVAELEKQVDGLASDVQKSKQGILEDAKINNFITIETELGKTDSAAIKSILVKLDGYDVYKIMDSSGLWMPSKKLPLYAGPLQPGAHRVDVEARIVLRHGKGLPLNNDVYQFLNKSFEILIPDGIAHKKYVIAIEPPTKLGENATATIKEMLKR